MKLHEIITHIENVAPLSAAAPWDNSGMQVAALRDEVTHVAAMLDPTPATVAKALDMGADFILSHHPLAIKARMPDTLDDFHAVLRLLFARDVPLYSAHTSLDANLRGPAAWLADAFSLSGRRCLEDTAGHDPAHKPVHMDDEAYYGFGIAGELPAPMSYAAFTAKLSAALGVSAWRASGAKPETIARIAYCPGSGESMIPAAAALRADVYLTGDVKYHAALETPIRVLDVGHFILEETMMRRFADMLCASCGPAAVSFIEAADPFTFEGVA